VLRAVLRQGQYCVTIGNGHFGRSVNKKPLNRSMPQLAQLVTSSWSPNSPQLIKIDQGFSSPHMGEIVDYSCFFFLNDFSSTYTTDAGSSTPTCDISIDAIWPKDVLLGVSSSCQPPPGVLSHQNIPSFWDINRDFQPKCFPLYLGNKAINHNA
jgi:hypothetical protein